MARPRNLRGFVFVDNARPPDRAARLIGCTCGEGFSLSRRGPRSEPVIGDTPNCLARVLPFGIVHFRCHRTGRPSLETCEILPRFAQQSHCRHVRGFQHSRFRAAATAGVHPAYSLASVRVLRRSAGGLGLRGRPPISVPKVLSSDRKVEILSVLQKKSCNPNECAL